MEQRDYLMKHIEQFGKVLKTLLGKLVGLNSLDKIEPEIKRVFTTDLNIDLEQLKSLTVEELPEYLITACKVPVQHFHYLAQILSLLGDAAKEVDDKTIALDYYDKALELHKRADEESKTFSFEQNVQQKEIAYKRQSLFE